MDRRAFLVRTGLTIAATALANGIGRHAAIGRAEQLQDWAAVRDLFSLSRNLLHFGGLYLASHPAPVQQAIDEYRAGLNDNPVDFLHQQQAALEAGVLRAAATYTGASPADIALTDSTTMGLGLLYTGLALQPGQEIITTLHDFYATHESLRLAALRNGARVRRIPLYQRIDTVSEDEIVQSVAQALTPATRILAGTWVHSSTGLKLPLRRIADVVANANAQRDPSDRVLLCVDGVHGIGVEDVTISELGCDFFVAGCHKWLFGPRGTGFVWGNGEAAWSNVLPTIPTFGDGRTEGSVHTPGGFHSFEHRWALRAAFDLHQQIGRARIAARIHDLNTQLKQGLAAMSNVRLYTPMDDNLSAGLVCFDVNGLAPQAVVDRLHERGIVATVTPYANSYARLAPGLLNSPEEVDTVLAAIRTLT
jgi:selenocysteine lyase/cysteine desulfurase